MADDHTPPATAAQIQSRDQAPVSAAATADDGGGIECKISPRALRAAHIGAREPKAGEARERPLRVFTQDGTVTGRESIATINVPYEPLRPGPIGSLLEIIDETEIIPPARASAALDLDDRFNLMQQGRTPSPTDPGFRAQNVYAICSTTYAAFRQALGRDLIWGFARGSALGKPARLRVRVSVPDEKNAYYDSQTGELRFGVFKAAKDAKGRNISGGRVYTALQHDVVVHEMSHALLDGLRAYLMEPTNEDVLAFHEGFADIVALFQRFTYREVVRQGIVAARGELRSTSLLTDLALQFGQALGQTGALRSAVAGAELRHGDSTDPHIRGTVLVAAIYEAFATIYDRKVARAIKLASNGTGVLPPGALPELLVDELVDEARKLAAQFLSICIRAVDYCPPIDITFGEYLRAMITADMDLVPTDPLGYRAALIDSFRSHDIYPRDQENLAEETLRWCATSVPVAACPSLSFGELKFRGDPATPADDRELRRQAEVLGGLVGGKGVFEEFGLTRPGRIGSDIIAPPIIDTIRTARRVGPDGQLAFDLVAEVIQSRTVAAKATTPAFRFYGGATIILDPKGQVRFVIRKRVTDTDRLARQAAYLTGNGQKHWLVGPSALWIPRGAPFRMIHEASRADAG